MMAHGGKRNGAGRPKGSNVWGESTKALRIPESRVHEVMKFLESENGSFSVPLYACKVPAGFPSPADDFIEAHLAAKDLNSKKLHQLNKLPLISNGCV